MVSKQKTTARKATKGKTRAARSQATAGRKRVAQKKKSRSFPVKSLLIIISLLAMLLITVGAVGYVIFFRTVLA